METPDHQINRIPEITENNGIPTKSRSLTWNDFITTFTTETAARYKKKWGNDGMEFEFGQQVNIPRKKRELTKQEIYILENLVHILGYVKFLYESNMKDLKISYTASS